MAENDKLRCRRFGGYNFPDFFRESHCIYRLRYVAVEPERNVSVAVSNQSEAGCRYNTESFSAGKLTNQFDNIAPVNIGQYIVA